MAEEGRTSQHEIVEIDLDTMAVLRHENKHQHAPDESLNLIQQEIVELVTALSIAIMRTQ